MYVQTGGNEETNNETVHGAAEWNTSIAYASGLLLSTYSCHSGVVSSSSVHLMSKAILKGCALKLLEAVIT